MNTLEFCEKYLKNYTINSDNTIDINGDVELGSVLDKNMLILPVKFGNVYGDFNCSWNNLTTLEGCPNYVDGNFYCYGNELTTLEGSPKYVGGKFTANYNNLISLKGIEKCEIIGNLYCLQNKRKIPPENYKYILTAKIGGEIKVGNAIDDILNTYKNEVKYLYKALSELKKVVI
jgi:hypothetical protein